MKKYDVVALGELLIDLTQNGISQQGNPLLEANPGGAPCNVLALLAKLGHSTAFIGKVGADSFGTQLENALKVHTLADGDRDFSFYRNPGADMQLCQEEVSFELIQQAKIFHFGTLSMTDEPVRSATYAAIVEAERCGVLRSFDPNLRPPLWRSLEEAKEQVCYGLAHCDILKISDNEIQWLTGLEDYDQGISWIRERYPAIKLILLSMGKDGSRAYAGDFQAEAQAFRVDTIETTGAGDTFFGAVLHHVLMWGMGDYTGEQLTRMLTFANAAAAIVTTRKGARRVMPDKEEIAALMETMQ